MEVTQALISRRTVRTFLSEPVPRDTVKAILEAALRTPSWANTQPWEIYIAGGEALERIRKASVERTNQGKPAPEPDVPFPEDWPVAYRERHPGHELRRLDRPLLVW